MHISHQGHWQPPLTQSQRQEPQPSETQAPLYTLKARIFAKSTFVIGYDTAIRLVMAKYYGSRERMLLELAGLRHRGCTFLVAGRVDDGGKFLTLADVDVPEEIRDLVCVSISKNNVFSRPRHAGRGLTWCELPQSLIGGLLSFASIVRYFSCWW